VRCLLYIHLCSCEFYILCNTPVKLNESYIHKVEAFDNPKGPEDSGKVVSLIIFEKA